MTNPNKIHLVEDNPYDRELTLSALADSHLTNEVFVVRDGERTLDDHYARAACESRGQVTWR